MWINKSDIRSLAKSFRYAWQGISYCVKNERNMRIHLSVTIVVSFFAYFYKVTKAELIVLLFCFGFVIASEAVNTAIEALVNLGSPQYSTYAKIAKDVAAGAVLVSAITAAITGIIIFWDKNRIISAFSALINNPIALIILAVAIIILSLFVFNGPRLYGEKTTRIYHMRTYKNNDDYNSED